MKSFRTYADRLIRNRESDDFPEINKFIPLKLYSGTGGLRVICQVTSIQTGHEETTYNDIFVGFLVVLPTFSGSIAYEFENEHIAEYGEEILEKLSTCPCMDEEDLQEQEEVFEFVYPNGFSAKDIAYQYASTYYHRLAGNPVKTAEKFIEDFIKGDLEVQDED